LFDTSQCEDHQGDDQNRPQEGRRERTFHEDTVGLVDDQGLISRCCSSIRACVALCTT
jgi:hypothetical protein